RRKRCSSRRMAAGVVGVVIKCWSPLHCKAASGQKETAGPLGAGGEESPSDGAVEESLELATAYRVLELAHRLGLDLTDALAGHPEDAAHFLQRIGVAVAEAVAELDDLALAVGQRLQDVIDLVLEHLLRRGANRRLGGIVLDEVAEVAVLALADRPIEADR